MRVVFVMTLIILAASCGNKKSSQSSQKKKSLDDIHARSLELTQKETISLIRKEQMISRFDCSGSLVSRKVETLNGLSKKITINYENRKQAWSYSVYNRRTKSANKGLVASKGVFVIDYAPTVFNMRVKEGINDIEYVFSKCRESGKDENGQDVCLGTLEVEKEGMIQLDVIYATEVLAGEQINRPSDEQCKPAK